MQRKSPRSNVNSTTVLRVTVAEAARFLDVSAEDVGRLVHGGTLDSIKVDGMVYVLVDTDQLHADDDQASDDTRFLGGLKDQVASLRKQLDQEREANRDTRRIIATLTQSVTLASPPNGPESLGRWSEVELVYRRYDDDPGPGPERSWWRKLLGG